jgi:hypothetical protein
MILQMHRQPDGSYLSEPAPFKGIFVGIYEDPAAGEVAFTVRVDRTLDVGDRIRMGQPVILEN